MREVEPIEGVVEFLDILIIYGGGKCALKVFCDVMLFGREYLVRNR
jgi:hypothetical protein